MNRRRFDTVTELLDHAFREYPDVPAYTCMGHSLSYAEIDELSSRFASFLQHSAGLEPGDRVAVQLPNILAYPVAAYGIVRAGMVLVNTNPLYTPRELRHQLRDSGAKLLVVLSNVANVAAQVVHETDIRKVVVVDLGDLHPWPKRPLINFVVRHVKKMVPPYQLEQSISLREALQVSAERQPITVQPQSLCALQYTGGTTGLAKGAMLSHANLCANVDQVLDRINSPFSAPGQIAVAALPLYHIFAFTMHAMCAFSQGANNLMIPNPRDLPALVKALKPHKISLFVGVNTLYAALARHAEFARLDFTRLKVSAAGGMAVTEDATRRWQAVTGSQICEGYGLSETSPVLSSNPDTAIEPGTIGLPLKDTQLKIMGEDGQPVADGEAGELWARGPQVMLGYWNNPQATAEVIDSEGWFKTGDIAQKRADGYYKLVDRKKDIINVSGFKVFPNEVEDVVCQLPAVLEAAVVGIPASEVHGERVKLFVVVTDDQLTAEDILEHCRKNLTAYKVPKLVEFRTQLPKSNVGKILRKDLRAEPVGGE